MWLVLGDSGDSSDGDSGGSGSGGDGSSGIGCNGGGVGDGGGWVEKIRAATSAQEEPNEYLNTFREPAMK